MSVSFFSGDQVVLSPPSPGSVAAAIGLGQGGNSAGGGGDQYGVSVSECRGADQGSWGEASGGDSGKSGCRRVLCRCGASCLC